MFLQTIKQIFIILVIMGVGYVARKRDIIDDHVQVGISNLVVNFGVPAAIFGMVGLEPSDAQRRMYFAGVLLSFVHHLSLYYILRYFFEKYAPPGKEDKAKIAVLLVTFSNCMFLGFPILQGLYGDSILLYGGSIVVSFNFVLYSIALPHLEREARQRAIENGDFPELHESYMEATPQKSIWQQILTPFNIATLVLLLFLFFGWQYPEPIQQVFDWISGINTPLSLIVIGSSLATSSLREIFTDRSLYFISFLRCLVVPVIVLLLLAFLPLGLDPELKRAMVVIAAMPSGANIGMLAEQCQMEPQWASMATTQNTILFIPTLLILMPLIEWLL